MRLSEAEYSQAAEQYQGYCTVCDDLTRDATEPDAENYKCPTCDGLTVMGTEQAMMLGKIEIV